MRDSSTWPTPGTHLIDATSERQRQPVAAPNRARGAVFAAVAAILLLGFAGACKVSSRRTPDDTIVVLIPSVLRDYDPRQAFTSYDTKLSRLVAPGLFTVDNERLTPEPFLAASWREVETLTWEFTLRDDARFWNGDPVTARDVAYTFESTMSPDGKSLFLKAFQERFKKVEAVDERRVRFVLQKPVATLLSDLTFGIVSESADRAGRVMGAGPYEVVSFDGDRVLLRRNRHYFGGGDEGEDARYFARRPMTEKIDMRVVRDGNARALMLAGGSADFTQNAVRVDLVNELASRRRVYLETGPSNILTYLMMQNEDPVLKDVRVRRAIAHAVDRKRLIDAKFHGYAVLATGMLPPQHWGYNADVARYSYDPDRARALLDEAGLTDPDGPGGEPRLRLTYKTSADQFRLSLARIIASQLGEVGIEVEVRSFEFGTFFADIKRGNFQIATMQTAEIGDPDYYYTYFHSERIPNEEHPHTHNRWRFRNARLDELTVAGRAEMDFERRKALYMEVQEILARELPIVPLWHEDNIAVMNKDLSGFRILTNARFTGLVQAAKRSRSDGASTSTSRASGRR